MNEYERETLLDILCKFHQFCQAEEDTFELKLIRICKNKKLFDKDWWSSNEVNIISFLISFADYCGERDLFLPFEMFLYTHEIRNFNDFYLQVKHPMIKFILDFWKMNSPARATLSCLQYILKNH